MRNLIRIYIPLLILQIGLFGCKNESEMGNSKKFRTCSDGIANAESDVKKGVYKLYSFGMPAYDDWDFQGFYEDFVYNEYNIKISNAGCEVREESECYAKKMKELIFIKFGKNIFKHAKSQAKIAYKKDIQSKVNSDDYIFSSIDSMPKFKDDNEKLTSYLKKNLKEINDLDKKVAVFFIVEKDGSISDVEIKRGTSKYDKKIKEVFSKMPNWNPGIYYGKPVRVRTRIPLVFKNNKEQR